MLEFNRCSECGSVLPSGAPGGRCPQCAAGPDPHRQPEHDAARAPTLPHPPQPAAGFVAPTPEQLAARFPQLEILALIGQGGMGAVYKARQPKLDRLVAVKILPQDFEADAAFAQRFTREARALAKLNHPNIVSIYDFGEMDGLFYFVMEYVDGVNLRQMIAGGKLAPEDALAIVPKICDALQFAHDEGIVHRDIKPANILVDTRGRVKIADFGLAKLLGHDLSEQMLTAAHQVMGTLRYMAPEQMQGAREVDHRADIYSLGVVFYEMLTGELPIGRFAPPSQKVAVDVRLDEVVLRSLETEPDRRYQHASDVKTDVEIIGRNAGTLPPMRGRDAPLRQEIAELPVLNLEAQEAARRSVRGPAIGLIVAGVVNLVLVLGMLAMAALAMLQMPGPVTKGTIHDINSGQGLSGSRASALAPALALTLFLGAPVGVALIIGGVSMRRLELYRLVMIAIVTAMLPMTFGCLVGLPCGIWALAVILGADVRAAFASNAQQRRLRPTALGDVSAAAIGVADSSSVRLTRSGFDSLPAAAAAAAPLEWSTPQDYSEPPISNTRPLAGTRPPAGFELAKRQTRIASVGLIASGVVNIGVAIILVTQIAMGRVPWPESFVFGLATLAALAVGILSILGGIQMRRLESHRLAVLATKAALLPLTPGFILVPYVIWARIVLGRDAVLAAFDYVRSQQRMRDSRDPALAAARRRVHGPAAGLICAAILNGVVSPIIIIRAAWPQVWYGEQWMWTCIAFGSFSLIVGILTFLGALHLRRLELYPLVLAGIIAAMLPITPGCLIGLPCGLWALAALRRPRVRAAFDSDDDRPPPEG